MFSSRRLDPYTQPNGRGANARPSIPMIPGFHVPGPRRQNFGKTHALGREAATDLENEPAEMNRPRPRSASQRRPVPGAGRARPSSAHAKTKPKVPSFVQNDRQVLRFYGYFKEKVPQSAIESERIRRVTIFFYLEDDSIHLEEPKQSNSGMPQGVMVRRGRYKDDRNKRVALDMLRVGTVLRLHGKRISIVDADAKTRRFFEARGEPQGAAQEVPSDRHAQVQAYQSQTRRAAATQGPATQGPRKGALRQFLELEGQVLRFDVLWDDTSSAFGEKRAFVLHYYLSNDTVEVKEIADPHSGRDNFPYLLRRQPLPKRGGADGETVHDSELICGRTVNVYGREMLLVDCDGFTKRHYRAKYGLEQQRAPGVPSAEEEAAAAAGAAARRVEVPPHNGFGSEEDTLASCYSLHAKPVKRDAQRAKRAQRNGGKILRYKCRLENPTVIDEVREFVVSFWMEDHTVNIFEQRQRNSGINGGKFLERGRYKNAVAEGGPRYFEPCDFFVGNRISVNAAPRQVFVLYEADEYTLRFCENNPADFPFASIDALNDRVMRRAAQLRLPLRRCFVDRDADNCGLLPEAEVHGMLDEWGMLDDCTPHELLTFKRKYRAPSRRVADDGADVGADAGADSTWIQYDVFCDAIARLFTRTFQQRASPNRGMLLAPAELALYQKLANEKTNLRGIYKRHDVNGDGVLSRDEFAQLLDYYRIRVSSDDVDLLMDVFDANRDGVISYHEFCDAVFPCDFSTTPTPPASRGSSSGSGRGSAAWGAAPAAAPAPRAAPRAAAAPARDAWGASARAAPAPAPVPRAAPAAAAAPAMRSSAVRSALSRLRSAFGDKKYALRKNFRAADSARSGRVDEEGFMSVLSKTSSAFSDDDMFCIAEAYFPNADSTINYQQFLGEIFAS